MSKKNTLFILGLAFISYGYSQNQTVGLFEYDSTAFSGYTLFSPDETTYLIDNCGKLVHSWEGIYNSGSSVYLLQNGDLLRTCRIQSTVFSGGGSGGRVEQRDWHNNLIWSYNFSTTDYHQHHDIEPMPNGNILILNWERKSALEAINAGRDSAALVNNELWATYIMEVEPVGSNDINIVWEWRLWDHLIQDFDSTKANYGIVQDNPQRLDINFYSGNGKKDWLHCNSIDYNAQLDQIVIGSRALSEFYIIDHSTSTAQAASNVGGVYGKGGDFLYRWGNPQSYKRGSSADQKLFGQHDVQWIPSDYPDGDKILLFNNGQNRGFSSVDVIDISQFILGVFSLNSNNTFDPDSAEWSYTASNPSDFYASYISGAQRFENGNTLICDGPHGRFFEIDDQKNIVWEYVNPIVNSGPLTQGDPIPISANGLGNSVFRVSRFPVNFPAFSSVNLTPSFPLELNPLPSSCNMLTDIVDDRDFIEKEVVRIVDLLGREIQLSRDGFYFYIYSDGSVEKIYRIR